MTDRTIDVIGVGSPIMDLLVEVTDDVLARVPGAKGGMELVDSRHMCALIEQVAKTPVSAPGGSAGNTTFAMARLGARAAFLGKLGADENGRGYREAFARLGGDVSRFKTSADRATASCLSLVTPDSERTMRTDLGAAMTLVPEEVSADDFAGCRLAHVEGYLLFNRELMGAVLHAAKTAGCRISLDLGSFEVVRSSADILADVLAEYVDFVFANEEEAAAFCGSDDPEKGLATLAKLCDVAAVKLGKRGALLTDGGRHARVGAVPVERPVDTTGAGDYWAAGFLYGHLNGLPLETCGRIGSMLGAEVVRRMGAELPDERWSALKAAITKL